MAKLAKDPKGWELEDLVAAQFVSRGCYVETGVKERCPDEILELDLFWTDYRQEPQERHPVEVKSGGWGIGDIFKFFGWTRYLAIQPGTFVYRELHGRVAAATLQHVSQRTGISLLHADTPENLDKYFDKNGFPKPVSGFLPELWRFSFWAQRRLLSSLQAAIRKNVFVEASKAAKEYHHLINDALFFVPDLRDRIGELLAAHFLHQNLGASAAYEYETGKVEFTNPPQTATFRRALFTGEFFPIQACLYLAHRARLYVLKALVEYRLGSERGEIKKPTQQTNPLRIDIRSSFITPAMAVALEELSKAKSFRMLPVFW